MTELPVTPSLPPIKPATNSASGKPANKEASDSEGFNNVLARQVETSDNTTAKTTVPEKSQERATSKETEPSKGKETSQGKRLRDTPRPESRADDPAEDPAIQASMLATLLAQTTTATPADTKDQPATLGELSDKPAVPGKELPDAATQLMMPASPQATGAITAMQQQSSTHTSRDLATSAGSIENMPTMNATRPAPEALLAEPRTTEQSGKSFDTKSALANPADATTVGQMSTLATFGALLPQQANTPAQPTTSMQQLHTPLGQPAWGSELGQKISWLATQDTQQASLQLNPPNLGPLEVNLTVQGDQASALFTSAHAAVRDAIEQALPRLREALAESGIMLSNASVSDQPHRNGQTDTRTGHTSQNETAEGNSPDTHKLTLPVRRQLGLVDTFA